MSELREQAAGGRWRTRANALTAVRLLAAPALALAVATGSWVPAAGLFALAVASDLADGRVARRYGESSSLGGLLDHAADATFVTCGLAALALHGEVPALLAPLVALAFAQYVVDSRAARGEPLRASRIGRWNGIAYYVLVAGPVVRESLGLGWPSSLWVRGLAWVLVASTLFSMADRVRRPLRS